MLLLFISACLFQLALSGNGIGPITPDFNEYLVKRGLAHYDFSRTDMQDFGSFGGKHTSQQAVPKTPIVFIHGNSDAALTANNFSTGFQNTVEYFLGNGYQLTELYATSWGDTNTTAAVYRDHDCHTLSRLRLFLESVLDYTGHHRVHMITHSMGVTLGRKIIQGGSVDADDGTCYLGRSLVEKVDIFIGIAGGNWGLCTCVGDTEGLPTCNKKNGLFPGATCGANTAAFCGTAPLPYNCAGAQYSQFLMDLNRADTRDGSEVFSMWSAADELIGSGDIVWGRPTSMIPSSSGFKIYPNYTHMQTKENTAADQYLMITQRRIPQ